MQKVVDSLIEEGWRKRILDTANTANTALRSDSVAWEEELKKRRFGITL
jgi:hypothetical protein